MSMANTMVNHEEEEMIRLAEEMSLLDEYKLTWDPRNLDDTKDRVKIYEEIVDGHYDGLLQDMRSDSPLSEQQIRDIFGYDTVTGSHVMGPTEDRTSTTSLSSYSQPLSELGGFDTMPSRSQRPVERRPTVRGREQMIQDTVHSVCRSLRWYQEKIVKEIESSKEVRLSPVLFPYKHI